MKISFLGRAIGAGAAALAMATCISAQAGTINLGTVGGTVATGNATTSGGFDDVYVFTIDTNDSFAAVAQSVTFISYGVSLDSIKLYSGQDASQEISTIPGSSSEDLGSGIVVDWISAAGVSSLPAGTYSLEVDGSSKGASAYSLILSLTPVAEPETDVLMLAGLGALGLMARRRLSAGTRAA